MGVNPNFTWNWLDLSTLRKFIHFATPSPSYPPLEISFNYTIQYTLIIRTKILKIVNYYKVLFKNPRTTNNMHESLKFIAYCHSFYTPYIFTCVLYSLLYATRRVLYCVRRCTYTSTTRWRTAAGRWSARPWKHRITWSSYVIKSLSEPCRTAAPGWIHLSFYWLIIMVILEW